MAEKRLFKELNQLTKSPPSQTNHQIISLHPVGHSVEDSDSDYNILNWEATIAKPTVKDSPYYYNGQWHLLLTIPPTYPISPPEIKFDPLTPINHPNINFSTGEICLDILKPDHWSPAWNLQHLIVAILMLIDDPEPDSPLNIDSANLWRYDKLAFESMVQYNMWQHKTFHDQTIDTTDSSGVKPTGETDVIMNDASQPDDDHDVDDDDDTNSAISDDVAFIKDNLNNTIITGGYSDTYTQNTTKTHRKLQASLNDPFYNDPSLAATSNPSASSSTSTASDALKSTTSDKKKSSKKHLRDNVSPNFKVIHDVGEEVTKQFIAKVNEIGHLHHHNNNSNNSQFYNNSHLLSNDPNDPNDPANVFTHHNNLINNNNPNNSNHICNYRHGNNQSTHSSIDYSSSNDDDLDSVRQQVTQNVTKQVEKLCSKSTSPEIIEDDESVIHQPVNECKSDDETVEKIKQQFLKQVDDKVNEVRKKQEEYQKRMSLGESVN